MSVSPSDFDIPTARGRREIENFLEAPLRFATIRSWATVFAMVFSVLVFIRDIALAETEEKGRWSIDFGAIAISKAFDQLTHLTGIKIFSTTPLAYTIPPKRYMNQSIEQILKDMLKNVNYAAVWHYGERGIESIGILAFDRERAGSHSAVSSVKRVGAISRSLPRSSGLRRLHPGVHVGGSGRDKSVKEPIAEPEETEGSEVEKRNKESVKSHTEADDTSNLASSNSQVEQTTDPSSDEESPLREQPKENDESGASTLGEKERVQME